MAAVLRELPCETDTHGGAARAGRRQRYRRAYRGVGVGGAVAESLVVDNRPAPAHLGTRLSRKRSGRLHLAGVQFYAGDRPALYKSAASDVVRTLDAVSLLAVTQHHGSACHVPVKTMADLLALFKAQPGKYAFGSAGAPEPRSHLANELFNRPAPVWMCCIFRIGRGAGDDCNAFR